MQYKGKPRVEGTFNGGTLSALLYRQRTSDLAITLLQHLLPIEPSPVFKATSSAMTTKHTMNFVNQFLAARQWWDLTPSTRQALRPENILGRPSFLEIDVVVAAFLIYTLDCGLGGTW